LENKCLRSPCEAGIRQLLQHFSSQETRGI